jgi:PKD repeat protein
LITWIHVSNVVTPPNPCNIDFNFSTADLSAKFLADFKGVRPDKISWDFGDGSSSSDAATSHTYAKAGEYKVTLYASINGVTCQITKVIKVGPTVNPAPCDVDFNWASSMLATKFQALLKGNTAPDKLRWDFGDGGSSSEINTSHVYLKSGEYKVTLYVVINGVECHVTKVIKVGTRVVTPPNKNGTITIYDISPNPASDVITVSVKSDVKARVTLVISDLTNINLVKQEIELEPGDNMTALKVGHLRPGVYLVSLIYDNKIISSGKFQKI